METEKKWRALHTRKGAENKVCAFIQKLSLDCFHPKFGGIEKKSMFKKNGQGPLTLLPSCVLVKCSDEDMKLIEHHSDVYNSFYWLGRKVELSEAEIADLKQAVDSGYDYVPKKYQGRNAERKNDVSVDDHFFTENNGIDSGHLDEIILPSLGLVLIRQNEVVSESDEEKEGALYEKYYYWL